MDYFLTGTEIYSNVLFTVGFGSVTVQVCSWDRNVLLYTSRLDTKFWKVITNIVFA